MDRIFTSRAKDIWTRMNRGGAPKRCVLLAQRAVLDRFHQQRPDCCQRLPLWSHIDIAEIRVAQTRR
jgi:Fe-S-cluster containining protein